MAIQRGSTEPPHNQPILIHAELSAIAYALDLVRATAELAALIESELGHPTREDIARHFRWTAQRAPREGHELRFVMGGEPNDSRGFGLRDRFDVCFRFHLWVMPTAVTFGQWQLMAHNEEHLEEWAILPKHEAEPITCLSWFDAWLFACWANHWSAIDPSAWQHARGEAPADHRFALPNEAEREFFTRAGTTTRYWSGDGLQLDDEWTAANSNHLLQPVATARANPWGFFDTLGNVSEWCDLPSPAEHFEPMADRTFRVRAKRAVRGGSRASHDSHGTSATRSLESPDSRSADIGLRLVLVHPGASR